MRAIQALGSLSSMFRQKSDDSEDQTAYISSKYQETVFARFFGGVVVDRGNDPYDVMIPSSSAGKRDLVGIKTFLNSSSSMQKIMQFKSVSMKEGWSTWIKNREYQRLIARISSIRNQKLRSTQSILAGVGSTPEAEFQNIYYHYLSPSKDGIVYIGESDYSFMDEDNLTFTPPDESKRIASVFFSDGKHEYKFTPADSTLYMRFMHTKSSSHGGEIVDDFIVRQITDPHAALLRLLDEEVPATPTPKTSVRDDIRSPGISRSQRSTTARKRSATQSPQPDSPLSVPVEHSSLRQTEVKELREDPKVSLSLESPLQDQTTDEVFVFPLFRLTTHGGTQAGEVDPKSGLNVRLGAPKNKGTETRRPVNEVEIKIPDAHSFHTKHPEFFGINKSGRGISELRKVNGKWKSIYPNKDDRTFNLTLTQSGVSMDAIITGDGNKQIMSKHSQQALGSWILSQVFQLAPYERLNRAKLDELDIDCIRLSRLDNLSIGLEFIKATDNDLVNLWPAQPEEFTLLATPLITEDE